MMKNNILYVIIILRNFEVISAVSAYEIQAGRLHETYLFFL